MEIATFFRLYKHEEGEARSKGSTYVSSSGYERAIEYTISGLLIRSMMRGNCSVKEHICICSHGMPIFSPLILYDFLYDFFSGLLCLPLQPIWLLCHVDQYHGACPDQLRNYAATGHVSVTLHSSVENVQSDAVSQVFNWKSLKTKCFSIMWWRVPRNCRWGTRDSMMMLFYPYSYYYSKT